MPAAVGSPPRSQYDRNLTIRIYNTTSPVNLVSFTFPIKPKELQRDTPARVSTTQTLQGVYQDFAGIGVTTLVLQGHTGWRRRANNGLFDGYDVFKSLYENVYLEYHKRIQTAANPNAVACILIDDLYGTVYRVSLDDMQATKSSSTPLLYSYTLRMTVKFTSPDTRDPVDYLGLPNVLSNNQNAVAQQVSNAISAAAQYAANPPRTYKVQSGDNLWTIAQKYYGDGNQDTKIANANSIKPPYTIYPNQILNIPY